MYWNDIHLKCYVEWYLKQQSGYSWNSLLKMNFENSDRESVAIQTNGEFHEEKPSFLNSIRRVRENVNKYMFIIMINISIIWCHRNLYNNQNIQ